MSRKNNARAPYVINDGLTYAVFSAEHICLCFTPSLSKAIRTYNTEIEVMPVRATFYDDLMATA